MENPLWMEFLMGKSSIDESFSYVKEPEGNTWMCMLGKLDIYEYRFIDIWYQ